MHPRSLRTRPAPRLSTLVALFLLTLASCGDDDGAGPGQTVSLSPGTVSLFVGETRQLEATVSGSSGAAVTYASSNDEVATVTQAGLVTAVGLGSATLTATVSGGSASATAAVTVNPSTVTAAPAAVELEVGETAQLAATVQGGVGLTVSWSSADETVATVGDDGEVTGEGVGTTTVTASVDGQPGVQANVEVTVTQLTPDLILESITTPEGEAIDPESVSGIIVFELTVSGPAGLTGEVDILLGDEVAATAPVSLSSAAVEGGPAAAPETTVRLSVATFSTREVEGVTQMRFPAGMLEASSRLRTDGGTVPGRIRGSDGPTTSLVINGSVVAIVEPVDEPEPVMGTDGNAWTSGALNLQGVIFHHAGVTPPTSVSLALAIGEAPFTASIPVSEDTFRVDLSAFESHPTGLGGFAGSVTFLGIEDQDQVAFPLANTYAEASAYFPGFVAPRSFWKDNQAPLYEGSPFEVTESYFLGKGLDLSDDFTLRASYDQEAWRDPGVGLYTCEWRAGYSPGNFDLGGFTSSDEMPQTSAFDLYTARVCRDPFGAEGVLPLNHPLGVDRLSPQVGWSTGSGFIGDLTVNPPAGALVQPTGFDPVPDALSGSSGMDFARWRLALTHAAPGSTPEAGCLTGVFEEDKCQKAPLTSVWIDGWVPDRSNGTGEYALRYGLFDLAGNRGHARVRWVDDTIPPVVTDIDYDTEAFQPGGTLTFSAQVDDDLETGRANMALRYLGLDYAFLGESVEIGTPYDGAFTNSLRVEARFKDFSEAIQTTSSSSPYGPTGTWFRATGALFGAQDTGGNVGVDYVDVSHLTSAPTGTQTAVDGTFLVPGPSVLGVPAGGACTVPTEGTYAIEALIPGSAATGPELNIDAARLYAVERLALSEATENAVYPVSGWIAPEVHDFGSFRAAVFETVVDPSVGPMPEGDTELFWHFRLPENRWLQSQGFSAEIRYCQ